MSQDRVCGLSNDEIAQMCYDHFNQSLTKKGKPQVGKEWTMLAAVLIQTVVENNTSCFVASMGTGSKCVGQRKLSVEGDILHDSHAEIIARRSFLLYLYSNLESIYAGLENILFELDPISKKCRLKKGISILFFSSHTPCGDGSIIPKSECVKESTELQVTSECLATKCEESEDQEPPKKMIKKDDIYRTGAKCVKGGPQDPHLPGTEHHLPGVLRTKPGRGDRTLSMSCSDKLAKWNILGIQGSLIMNFLEKPIYISRVVIGKSPFCPGAMQRALLDRFKTDEIELYPFKQQLIIIGQSCLEFQFCKSAVCRMNDKIDPQPCPSSIIWCLCSSKQLEVAVEGKKQGATKKTQNRPSGRLAVCKKNLLQTFTALLRTAQIEDLPNHLKEWVPRLEELTYSQAKRLATNYADMWQQLRAKVMPTWTLKGAHLMEFTAQEK